MNKIEYIILTTAIILITVMNAGAQYPVVPESSDGGIGIILSDQPSDTGFLLVKEVIINSPAFKAGITKGEAVMKVDTVVTWLKSPEFVYSLFEGNAGTKVEVMLWKKDHNYALTLTRENVQIPLPPPDTINHNRPLPMVQADQAFCDSFGSILAQAPDSFKKLHDSDIIYDNFDISGGVTGHYPYGCRISLPGSIYTNYIYSDSLTPAYFIANYKFNSDSSKAWQSFVNLSAQVNQFLDENSGSPCSYLYNINQRSENIDKKSRICDAAYTFTLGNEKDKRLSGILVDVTFFSYSIEGQMQYYGALRIWAP